MSKYLGAPQQVGYVVKDVEAAMKHWTEKMEVGPFFYKEDIGLTEFTYYGKPVDELPIVSIGIANSGPTQIELIQVRNDTPTAWTDSLKANGEGPQHIAYWTTDYDDKYNAMAERGFAEAHAGRSGGRGRFSYFVHDDVPGTVIELSEYTGGKDAYFKEIAAAAESWDGSEPIRRRTA